MWWLYVTTNVNNWVYYCGKMEDKEICKSIGFGLATAIVIGFGVYKFIYKTPEYQFGKFAENFKKEKTTLDSIYDAEKYSLRKSYESKIDSLEEFYSRKDYRFRDSINRKSFYDNLKSLKEGCK